MKILRHRLYSDDGNAVEFYNSPNRGRVIDPEYLVIHFTKGASARSSINWLTNPASRASAHLVIGRDGSVVQLVEFNRKAWHAGYSRWEDKTRFNNLSIGIELDNYGDLIGGPGKWRTTWGKSVSDDEVIELPHMFDNKVRGWHVYTEPQLTATASVATLLIEHYELKNVLGHDEIAPGRELAPGPAFYMDGFRATVLGRQEDTPITYITTTSLNIRQGPGTRYEKLPVSPLPKGTKVEILSSNGLWREVDVLETVNDEMDIVGWVHGRFIRRSAE